MRCVFGIDVSKDSISVAIVIDQTMFKETKLPLNRDGFRKLEEACSLLTILRSFLKLPVFTHDGFSDFLMISAKIIPA
ncbi:hypothetical protein [Limosilactobacillus vaginalis]|uniref:hypothetical protein n=1 Tax=Limosilactobacillus vaginalis TaxID=1633 RepID=UPI0022A97948|nr:hypothetical protein [Limosilactobacillus vaginalis]